MNAPRLFVFGGCLLLLNLAAVLSTGIWRYVGADEPRGDGTRQPVAAAADAKDTHSDLNDSESAPTAPVVAPASTSSPTATDNNYEGNGLLEKIPIPESLPEIPSLADPESLKNDPGFQEFSRLFSKVEEEWENDYPNSAGLRVSTQSTAYFDALDGRLQTVEQLCSAARQIAREASRHSRSGRIKECEELVKMATQLRDMAAQLLVGEL